MTQQMTGYPSIDKPWLKYYSEDAINAPLPTCNIYEYLWDNNKDHLNEIAINYFEHKISFRTLFNQIALAENGFRSIGVRHGDVVIMSTVALPETIYSFYALAKIGAIAEIVDPRLSAEELREYITTSNANVIMCLEAVLPLVAQKIPEANSMHVITLSPADSLPMFKKIAYRLTSKQKHKNNHTISWEQLINLPTKTVRNIKSVSADDPALMTHTSGTTGKAKGVVLSHANINAVAFQYSLGMEHFRQQKYLDVIPPFIAFGICVAIHLPLSMGMVCIPIPKFEVAKFYEYIKKYKPNHFTCTPSNLDALSNDKRDIDLSFFRVPSVGGDYISATQEQKINEYLKEHRCQYELVKGYGMTEVSSSACTTMNHHNKMESVGFPLCKMMISIFEPGTEKELHYGEMGEICFSGPNVMIGYYKNENATKSIMKIHSDGKTWIHSGDIGYMDSDGYVFVMDRMKRMIHLSNGIELLPSVVERCLTKMQQIEACAVVGYKNTDQTIKAIAYVVLKENVSKKEILSYCQEQLDEKIIPSMIKFVDRLPVTLVGKIDYRALEKEAEKGAKP